MTTTKGGLMAEESTVYEPVSRPLSDYPLPQPCCQRAHEQGYRRGYVHGYRYAAWDLQRVLPLTIWAQLRTFIAEVLDPWRRLDAPKPTGPRLRVVRPPKKQASV